MTPVLTPLEITKIGKVVFRGPTWTVLRMVYRSNAPLYIRDISDRTGVSYGEVSKVITLLDITGLVKRKKIGRRVYALADRMVLELFLMGIRKELCDDED